MTRSAIISVFVALMTFSCENTIKEPEDVNEEWSFVVFSDVQHGYGVFSALAKNISELRPVPLAAVCLGDIMYRSANEAEWFGFIEAAKPLKEKMPIYLARGNHEGNDPVSEECLREYGSFSSEHFYYPVQIEDLLLIILDTSEPGRENEITGEQFIWLRNALDTAKVSDSVSFIFIMMHQPLWPQGKHKGEELTNSGELHNLFVQHGKIVAVFSGHDHIFNRYVKDGLTYITTGGGGGRLYSGYGGDYHHFTKVTKKSDASRINIKTLDIFGEAIDTFDL